MVEPAEQSVRAVDMSRSTSLSSGAPSVVFSEAGHESVSSVSDVDAEGEVHEPARPWMSGLRKGPAVPAGEARLQKENQILRARVEFLETELDGCLEMLKVMGV